MDKSNVIYLNSRRAKAPKARDNLQYYKLDKPLEHTAYCLKCKRQTGIHYAQGILFKNGRKGLEGQCQGCNTNCFKILGSREDRTDYEHIAPYESTTEVATVIILVLTSIAILLLSRA